jgi:hypothetical protein
MRVTRQIYRQILKLSQSKTFKSKNGFYFADCLKLTSNARGCGITTSFEVKSFRPEYETSKRVKPAKRFDQLINTNSK